MPAYSSFIRSIRMRYLSGLLIFAFTTAAVLYPLNSINTYRHQLDRVGSEILTFAQDLRNTARFADQMAQSWSTGNREQLTTAAASHASRIEQGIEVISAEMNALKPRFSKETVNDISAASINDDPFWSARDIARNLNAIAVSTVFDESVFRAIRNQNELFAQPMLTKTRVALDEERRLADSQGAAMLMWAGVGLMAVIGFVAMLVFKPMEKAIRRAFEETEQLLVQAEAADRAKSEFLANMSHEIRTPMNGVLGMAELLAKTELNQRQKTFTDVIVKSGNALLAIINDILDFSKINAGQLTLDPHPFCVAEAVEDVATLISTRVAEKNLELIVRIDPQLPSHVVGDLGRFRQIVTNLVGNAVKFTERGHVLVDVSGQNEAGTVQLKVRVEDTGIGIPAEKLQTVFEKFAQVDGSSTRRHEGTGLGLAIAARLVDFMGGKIGIESEVGRGSVFWFCVPLPVHDSAEIGTDVPVDVTGARVLVIDDNPVNREILLEQLKSWGFDAAAAESGAMGLAVLDRASKLGAPVDCVILDYQMPGMTGADVARAMNADVRVASVPIVLLTSVDQVDFGKLMMECGIAAHLTKPARSANLLGTVVAVIQKARTNGGRADYVRPSLHAVPAASPVTVIRGLAPAPAASALEPAAAQPGVPLDILVAEDNEVNQLVFGQILSGLGLSFRIAGNGRTAVEMYRSMNPKLMLMDVSMPEMNGYEATRAIRQIEAAAGTHVPIIGITAHALKGDREKCIEAGMDDYLPKPISPDRLGTKIAAWLSETVVAKSA